MFTNMFGNNAGNTGGNTGGNPPTMTKQNNPGTGTTNTAPKNFADVWNESPKKQKPAEQPVKPPEKPDKPEDSKKRMTFNNLFGVK